MRFGGRKTPKEKKEGRQRQQRVISCSSASDSNDGSGRCFSDDKFSGCRIEIREGVPQYILNLPFHFGFRRRPQAHCHVSRVIWKRSCVNCGHILFPPAAAAAVESTIHGTNLLVLLRRFSEIRLQLTTTDSRVQAMHLNKGKIFH